MVAYERTPVMSTYLVAFVVGEYDYVEGTDADGVKVRVYTGVGKKEQGRFALDVSTSRRQRASEFQRVLGASLSVSLFRARACAPTHTTLACPDVAKKKALVISTFVCVNVENVDSGSVRRLWQCSNSN